MNQSTFRLTPLALGALLFSASVSAQTTAPAADQPASDQPMQTVVVTASADASAQGLPSDYAGGQVARGGRLGLLGNVDIMSAPFNTTNYTHALIQDQQARSVADVVQNDPSVRVARGFGNYQELYVIRGFAVNSDDLAYNGLYGLLPRQFVAAELLERVEVFRGANSFVNGAAPGGGGIGGMINLLPKRAPNKDLNQFTVGVESGGQLYGAADLARRFGPDKRGGIRINAVRRDGDTAIDREERELSVFSIGADWRGDAYRVSADVGYQDHKLVNARPSVTVGPRLPIVAAPSSDSNWAQPWTNSKERDVFGTLRAEVDLGANSVGWAALGMRKTDESNVLASMNVNAVDGGGYQTRFDNVREDDVKTGEIGARTTLRTGSVGHTLSATVSGFHSESKNAYAMGDFSGWNTNIYRPVDVAAPPTGFWPGGDMFDPLVTRKTILSSAAIADTLSFLDDSVLLTVGIRHQRLKDEGYDYVTGGVNARYNRSENTPLAGIVFKPAKGVSLYANYIEALQQGGSATRGGFGNTELTNEGMPLAPYVSRQKEVGVKVDGGKLGGSVALFTTGQPQAYILGDTFGTFGEQRNRGVELSVFGLPTKGLRLLGGATLLDTKQRDTLGGATDGLEAIGVPEIQVNLGADWDVPGVPGLSLNARALYTSTQFADIGNTQKVPAWSRLDIGASWATRVMDRDVTLRARVDNVTDKNYWASSGGYPLYGYLVAGAPRTLAVSATVDF
ncbi:TonB-dependent receptor [Massilia sp. YIM B02769]|uniref:TonB-dependent receptor n=1 Tax=Massilia sp. YIM B02769 TaxID=3050129 RepID=UPI0025B73303|nr:TonB-dependent receptor [Massilia sp. YIM B02769]MDN4060207.1 TonB-dependent receptor [Massilia sp. YIM B02769]